jgi:hypothetical protein
MGCFTKQVAGYRYLDCSPLYEYTTIARCHMSTDIDVQRPNDSTIFLESTKSLPHRFISVVIAEIYDGISACSKDENLIVLIYKQGLSDQVTQLSLLLRMAVYTSHIISICERNKATQYRICERTSCTNKEVEVFTYPIPQPRSSTVKNDL